MERRPTAAPDLDELLTIETTVRPDGHRISLSGELDLSTRARVIAACTDEQVVDVLLDLSALTFLDCAGYQALLDARRVLVARGGSLDVINLDGEPRYLLEMIRERELVPW